MEQKLNHHFISNLVFVAQPWTVIIKIPFLFAVVMIVGCGLKPSPERSVPTGQTDESATANSTIEPPFDRQDELRRSERLAKEQNFTAAGETLRRILLADPNDIETLFRLANVQAAAGNLDEAISLLASIPEDHPEAGLPAIGQAADWCMECERYDEAETRYRTLIERLPEAIIPRRKLAYLYNRQGRRHEAAEQIRHLCRLGDVRQDELHALMSLSDAVFDDPAEHNDADRTASPLMLPIGPAAYARIAFTERKYTQAVELLQDLATKKQVPPSVNAFYGRSLAEAQYESRLLAWIEQADEPTKQFAEYWAAVGTYLVGQLRFKEAVRVLGEAILRDSTDLRSLQRLNQSLVALGEHDAAKRWFDRYKTLRDITTASGLIGAKKEPNLEPFPIVVEGLIKLDRPLEAVMWQLIEALYRGLPQSEVTKLSVFRKSLLSADKMLEDRSKLLCGLDLNSYPLPQWNGVGPSETVPIAAEVVTVGSIPKPRFENIAERIGLRHEYMVASKPIGSKFSIYQVLGGGVAALDYDLDGSVDLYLAQGGCDPPNFLGNQTNILFRSLDGQLKEVTIDSGTSEFRYSMGLTSGDWNQDGFPDLVIANIGRNTLLLNNGDGTFTTSATDPLDDPTVVSSSVALADVTGDAMPDIVDLSYLHDSTLAKKPIVNRKGEVEAVFQGDFKLGMARVLVNDQGRRDVMPISSSDDAQERGLGMVISDFNGTVGNEIFIGNDQLPDQLWQRAESNDKQSRWINVAPIVGCALGNGGTTTASMGIAAADFDNSGTLDLYITNFQNEPSSFFLNRGQMFQDRSVQYKLVEDSLPVLGFGCQPIDYNNDGNLDIVVTNGHIEKTGVPGELFEQPGQLFVNLGANFQLMQVDDPSGYFGTNHVGRGLATLDFNHDGKLDFVVTHIETPTALLINQTETNNRWLKIHLVGTKSERDAIGAKVKIRAGNREWTQWAIAGDGYLCNNEDTLSFGLGEAAQVDEVIVTWPAGTTQEFKNVSSGGYYLLVEGDDELFALGHSGTKR